MPPYDRLTAIYQAAAELSGDTSLPDSRCVSGKPPFGRFSYIYAAFRVLAADSSLPSQECVEGMAPASQVNQIYRAAAIWSGDSSLATYRCVSGMPMWSQWLEIYRAIYLGQGSPDELTDPRCVSLAGLDVLSEVFCGLVAGCVTPTLVSASINEATVTLVFSQNVTGGTGFDITIDGDTFTLVYASGSGTNTLVFGSPEAAAGGAVVTLDYAPGNIVNGDCPLAAFSDFPVDNELDQFSYFRPGGVFTYFRPDGTSIYIRP